MESPTAINPGPMPPNHATNMIVQRNSGTGAPTRWSASHIAIAGAPATNTKLSPYFKIRGGVDHQPGADLAMKRPLQLRAFSAVPPKLIYDGGCASSLCRL